MATEQGGRVFGQEVQNLQPVLTSVQDASPTQTGGFEFMHWPACRGPRYMQPAASKAITTILFQSCV